MRGDISIRVTQTGPRRVTVTRRGLGGEREQFELMVPSAGGYVLVNDGRNFPQICEGLCGTGTTLTSGGDDLLAVVRRQAARWRRQEVRWRREESLSGVEAR